jgi:hypothetical protein
MFRLLVCCWLGGGKRRVEFAALVDDLFFVGMEGQGCPHGEDRTAGGEQLTGSNKSC